MTCAAFASEKQKQAMRGESTESNWIPRKRGLPPPKGRGTGRRYIFPDLFSERGYAGDSVSLKRGRCRPLRRRPLFFYEPETSLERFSMALCERGNNDGDK